MQVIPMASWTPEYCIVCDKQCIQGSVYCSDKCRHSEMQYCSCDVRKSEHQRSNSRQHTDNDMSTDSSDEEAELSGFSLSQKSQADSSNKLPLTKSKMLARKEGQFLYASPKLYPTKNPKLSPAMSPLLIPTVLTPEVIQAEQMSVQSVNTYKRWLSNNAT